MTPSSQQPSDRPFSQRSGDDGYDIVIEGPGDKTRRPRRPSIPYTPPDEPPLPPTEQKNEPPEENKDKPGDNNGVQIILPSARQPLSPHASQASYDDTYLIIIEGPGDKTRRPRRPSIPYTPPDEPPLPSPEQKAEPLPPEEDKDKPSDTGLPPG
jgi:hypothetical protein